jgi:hypothetical protein
VQKKNQKARFCFARNAGAKDVFAATKKEIWCAKYANLFMSAEPMIGKIPSSEPRDEAVDAPEDSFSCRMGLALSLKSRPFY